MIEIAGRNTYMTVSENTAAGGEGRGAFFCGEYGTGLEHSVISDNAVMPTLRNDGSLFFFEYHSNWFGVLYPDPATPGAVRFNNNTFSNNSSGGVFIDFSKDFGSGTPIVLGPGDVTNNVFSGNTFTPRDLTPASGFVDGGGNHCSSTVPPITCH